MDFIGFLHGSSSYVVLYTQCLRYNICSAWFLDIRMSTCLSMILIVTGPAKRDQVDTKYTTSQSGTYLEFCVQYLHSVFAFCQLYNVAYAIVY